MNEKTILVATSSFTKRDSAHIQRLKENGFNIHFNPFHRRMTEKELCKLLNNNVIGVIAGLEPYTEHSVQNASQLKVISRCGIATDNVDRVAIEKKGISLYNTPDAPSQSVAELTVGLILSVLRHIPCADKAIRSQQWKPRMGSLLHGKTVGLLGYGRIGKKVANLLQAFGANLLIHDPYPQSSHSSGSMVDFERLIASSDIISLHCPSSDETRHMINEKSISMMRKGTYIINTSRGDLIDESALVSAIKADHIAGAGLDVYEHEPYHGPLFELDQVVMTAHMGSYAKESRLMMEEEALRNLCTGLQKHNLLPENVDLAA